MSGRAGSSRRRRAPSTSSYIKVSQGQAAIEPLAGSASGDTEWPMPEEHVEIVRRFWAALNEDPPRLPLEFVDESTEIRNPPEFPLKGPFRGREGARVWMQEVWEILTGLHF